MRSKLCWPCGACFGLARAFAVLGMLASFQATSAAELSPAQPAVFERIGNIEQIPDGVITSLAQGAYGLIWIGTTDGLVRYDGYRFRRYLHDANNAESVPGNRIQHLLTGVDGRLWIGTYSDGVAVYDPDTDRFTRYQSDPARPDSLPPGTVRAMAQTPDGAIWVGTTGNGLGRIDADGRVRRFIASGPDASLLDDRISALGVDRAGTLWLGSWQGLSRLVHGAQRFERVLSEPDDRNGFANTTIRGIHVASNGDVWIGAQQGHMARLPAALLGRAGEAMPAPTPDQVVRWRGGGLNSAVEPGDGSLWVAHAQGIDIYDLQTAQVRTELRHRAVDPMSLSNAEVRALLLDRSGWIWAGSFGGGLQRIDPRPQAIYARRFDPLLDAPLSQLSALTLTESRDGGLWVGVARNGLLRMDAQLRIREFLRSGDPEVGAFSGQQPSGLIETADASLWVATESGLYRRPNGKRTFELISGPDFLEGASVRRLWAGSEGRLWIATGDGLFRRDHDGRIRRLASSAGDRIGGSINALVLDSRGGWVGGTAGLFRMDEGGERLQPIQFLVDGVEVRSDALGLLLDRQGRLWVDADGLYELKSLEAGKAHFKAISRQHGEGGVAFGGNLLDDEQGRIWSQRFVYDPAQDSLQRLGRADGAHAGTGWFRANARLPDGRLVFGATEGLLQVTPKHYARWNYAAPLVLTGLRLDGESARIGPGSRELEIAAHVRNFEIEFAALDYSAPEMLRYRHRMIGVDDDWVSVDASSRDADYGGLWPGVYRFQAQASDRAGEFNGSTLELSIRVLPQWWQTWPAALAGLLLFSGGLWLLMSWRVRSLRSAKIRLETQVNARTADLSALSAELARKNSDFEQASLTDPLTGLRNRRFAMQEMPKEVALCLRRIAARVDREVPTSDGMVLFLIDFDHFKEVNDDFGHAAGDTVLSEFALRLRAIFRASDHLIRWGGEEFLVVARETDREGAAELAERVRREMAERPFLLEGGHAVRRTVSIGFAPFPLLSELPAAAGWEEVVDLVDQLMYGAKRCGRNAWVGVFPERVEALPRHAVQWCEPGLIRSGAVRLLSSVPEGRVLAALGEPSRGVELGV